MAASYIGNTVTPVKLQNSYLFVVSRATHSTFFTWKCKHRPYSIRKFQTLFSILARLSSVTNSVIVYVHYIPSSNTCLCVCISVYLSSLCMLVCTVSCQSVTLMSHTTCLSFVNVYVDTCPPICHIHVRYFPSLHVRQSVCDTPSCTHVFLFFVYVCQYTCLSVTFICTMFFTYVCVSVFLRSYVRISCSQLCVRASVWHIHVYYTSFSYTSTTVCRSTRLCVCLLSCKCITCTVVCPSVCYIRAPSPNTCLCV